MNKPTIGIVGSKGIVGKAIKKWFESQGHTIYEYDVAPTKRRVYEQEIEEPTGSMEEVNKADFIYLCLPTPFNDIGYDISAIHHTLAEINDDKIVILKSTLLPGTTKKLQSAYTRIKLLHNPEFLTASSADQDMAYPDRQIVGTTVHSRNVAKDVILQLPLAPYERIVNSDVSETIKLATNAYMSVKNTFSNQIYDLCEKLDVDYEQVREGLAADKRIERTHLDVWHNYKEKGHRGYAGMCLPKDMQALLNFAKSLGVSLPLLATTQEVNEGYKETTQI